MSLPRALLAGLTLTLAASCAIDPSPTSDSATATGTAQALGEPPPADTPFAYHSATLLGDGTVLVVGGLSNDDSGAQAHAFLYVSAEVGLRKLPDMASPRYGHTATRLLDGTVLVAGGFDSSNTALSSAELYDPDQATFTELGAAMRARRGAATATLLGDGRVLIAGGFESGDRTRESAGLELYDPVAQRFSAVAAAASHGGGNVALTLGDGRVAVFWRDGAAQQVFDPTNDSVVTPAPPFFAQIPIAAVTAATRLPDDSLVVFDGARLHHVEPSLGCHVGEAPCGDTCIDVTADAQNCGACGVACMPNGSCVNGQCTCTGYQTECRDGCQDLNNDPLHCGSCGTKCAAGTTCVGGACYDCAGVVCGSECVDITTDAAHCGSCSNACASGQECSNGTCGCVFPTVACGQECVDTTDDAKHCGDCDTQCPTYQTCVDGTCTDCSNLEIACNGVCTDLYNDPNNCGACGTSCGPADCFQGTCRTCPSNQALCNNSCESLETNANCGACGEVCPQGFQCQGNGCVLSVAETGVLPSVGLTLSDDSLQAVELDSSHEVTDALTACWPPCAADIGYAQPGAPPAAAVTFGGEGHTTTALADGSLLAVGGKSTARAWRLGPHFHALSPPAPLDAYGAGALLADGRLLIVTHSSLTEVMGEHVALLGSLPEPWAPLGAALQPSGSVLLVNAAAGTMPAVLFDPANLSAEPVRLRLRWDSTRSGRSLPVGDGSLLVAGRDGVELVHAPDKGGAHVDSVPLELGCDRPALARLTNGRILVVGSEALYELDPRTATASEKVDTILGRCRAGVVIRHDGTALIIGGYDSVSDTPTAGAELYDPVARKSKYWSMNAETSSDERNGTSWFDTPLLFGESSGGYLDYQADTLVSTAAGLGNAHLDATGALVGVDYDVTQLDSKIDALSFQPAPTLRIGDAIDFEAVFPGHPFPGRAPEGSSGTTQASPTNLPIPVWFPAEGGWPSLGTLTRTGSKTTYRVPVTPFPGLGLLFLSTNGKLEPLGPVTIAGTELGAACGSSGECASGYCVDGVCCNTACDGACEACVRTEKGTGEDGTCGPVAAGSPDDACHDELETCGEKGTCDGRGQCAHYEDGARCAPDAACSNGRCVVGGSASPTGEAGTQGKEGAGGSGGSGGGGGSAGAKTGPRCNADEKLVSPDGTPLAECSPYRCRDAGCVSICASTRDCASGYACNGDGRCVTPSGSAKSSGCGCRVTGDASPEDWSALGLAAVACLLVRRTRRQRTLHDTDESLHA